MRTGGGHNDDAIDIGNHHVTGLDLRTGADHVDVDGTQRGLDGALGIDGAAENGEAHLLQLIHIAHTAVDDQSHGAAGLETGGQQVAKKAVEVVGGAGCHHHVAGLNLFCGYMHHPVVTGLQQHRDGRATHARALVDGAHIGLHQTDATHGLVDGGDAEAAQLFDRSFVGAVDIAFDDSEFVHAQIPFCVRAASRRGNTRRTLPS